MKALVLTGYGDNANLRIMDMPKPTPGPAQVLIQIAYAGLNPLDYKIRNGKLRLIRRLRFPHIMGNEIAGTVVAVGPGVTEFRQGDHVYSRLHKDRMAAFAEFVVEDISNVAFAPKSIGSDVAAGVPLAALTAWQSLHDVAGLKKEDKILIHGGGGSVGRFAIQFAKAIGAHVTTTVSDWAESLVKELGADTILNYKKQQFDDRVDKYDVVYDLVGGDTLDRSFKVIKVGGKVISIAGKPEPHTASDLDGGLVLKALFYLASRRQLCLAQKAGAHYRYFFMRASGVQLREIASMIDSGQLKVSVDKVFSLDDYRSAFEYQESGKAKGKVVIAITGGK